MTRLEALRRYSLAHPPTCKRLSRLYTDDEVLARVLGDERALESHLMGAARLNREALDRILSHTNQTEGEEAQPVTAAMIMDVRMVAKYG